MMQLTQVKGNTWVLEGSQLIPLYKLDDRRCVLLDSGLLAEREELEQSLAKYDLEPVGILCSHAHVDHCANNGYFQQTRGIPVALTGPEAGMCSTILTLKCYFLLLSPGMVERESSCMVHTPDVIIPPQDGPMDFCGATFQIVHTPGHSSGHICVVTPDNVCYTADAMLSWELMEAKLPYNLCHELAETSREKLRHLGCDAYIMAHRGVCSGEEIGDLIDRNVTLIHRRADEIFALIDRPMTGSEVAQVICERYELFTRQTRRSLRFERNIRFFVEYLVDQGRLETECRRGVTFYRRPL